jgi:hypothetical protein
MCRGRTPTTTPTTAAATTTNTGPTCPRTSGELQDRHGLLVERGVQPNHWHVRVRPAVEERCEWQGSLSLFLLEAGWLEV